MSRRSVKPNHKSGSTISKSSGVFSKPSSNVQGEEPIGPQFIRRQTSQHALSFDVEELIQDLEDNNDDIESMGDVKVTESRKSNIMERNLNQMVDVLRLRLDALDEAAKLRIKFCEEDLIPNSKKSSKEAPLIEELDDSNPRIFRDKALGGLKDNLVSTDGVFIDPVRLVIKTKIPTEAGKKLEVRLEETFGMPQRDQKGKKSKTSTRAARSKKSEARKSEAKKLQREKLQKDLQTNTEAYVTRSIMDQDLDYKLPDHETKPPISVKWCSKDVRAQRPENAEGEMDPLLLLTFGLEKIQLPSSDAVFRWLVRQPMLHSYFVHLFWFIRVKFFQREVGPELEGHFLQVLSSEYVKIVEALSRHTHEEHEKDFVFRFLPYILSNSIHWAFYYLCPGSRHVYTKSLKKTVVLQVVKLLNGIQLCPISLRVNWAKLFPEDVQDDEEGGPDDGELFPAAIGVSNVATSKKNALDTKLPIIGSDPTSRGGSSATSVVVGVLEGDEDTMPQKVVRMAETVPGRGEIRSAPGGLSMRETEMTAMNNPLARIALKPPPARPRNKVFTRQKTEIMDANNLSPLMQEYLGVINSSGGKRHEPLRRTVPVSWCVTGGSDTHHKKVLPKQLHDELSLKVKDTRREAKEVTLQAHHEQIQAVADISHLCGKVLASGASTVGRYSLELVKHRKNPKAGFKELDLREVEGNARVPGYSTVDASGIDEEEQDF